MQERRHQLLMGESMPLRRAGVLGKPIGHTLSPVIHNAGYAAAGLTGWRYTAHECDEADLAGFVAGLGPEWAGLSLTMPLKEVALDVAGEVSAVAAALGAANTLVRLPANPTMPRPSTSPDVWRAENTDAPGIVDALVAAGVTTVDRFAILGAGGTARAALAAARELGATRVTVYARRPAACDELALVAKELGFPLIGASWADAPMAGADDVVVSTVPKGVADPLAATMRWRPGAVLFDAIYDPWPTPLAASAVRQGCRIVSGLDLLLTQAVLQFEFFTGVTAPVAAMRSALFAAAHARPANPRLADHELGDAKPRRS
jgi:shikimate dehydrogenase